MGEQGEARPWSVCLAGCAPAGGWLPGIIAEIRAQVTVRLRHWNFCQDRDGPAGNLIPVLLSPSHFPGMRRASANSQAYTPLGNRRAAGPCEERSGLPATSTGNSSWRHCGA